MIPETLIVPEAGELKRKIAQLPKELLNDPRLAEECRETSETVGNLFFWNSFFKDNNGLNAWEKLKAEDAYKASKESKKKIEQIIRL